MCCDGVVAPPVSPERTVAQLRKSSFSESLIVVAQRMLHRCTAILHCLAHLCSLSESNRQMLLRLSEASRPVSTVISVLDLVTTSDKSSASEQCLLAACTLLRWCVCGNFELCCLLSLSQFNIPFELLQPISIRALLFFAEIAAPSTVQACVAAAGPPWSRNTGVRCINGSQSRTGVHFTASGKC